MTQPFLIVQSARTAALCLVVPGARYSLPQPLTWRLLPLGHAGPERQGTARSVVMLLDGLEPGQRFRFEAEGLEPFDFETQPCSGLLDAANFGFAGDTPLDDMDAARNNAEALSKAVVATPEGGTLQLGPGTWTSFPVGLKSRMTLRLAPGAVLRAPSGRSGWPIFPAHDHAGGMLGSWEGLPSACFAAPLHAVAAEHLTIEGQGILDGSAERADWWSWPKETRDGARRPRGLHLISCRDVKLLGFTIRNAASWTIHPQGCDRLTAAGLTIIAPHDSPNTDGFNPESCRNVTITGVHFSVGDDCIAVKAGKRGADGAAEHLSETRGVHVSHCLMERGHGGLVIGSEMSGGVHDVTVEDCEMIATDRGFRLKTRRGRGGSITNIVMRRVLMDGVHTGLSANAHYHCDADGHDDWVQSRTVAPIDAGTPDIDGIVVEDVEMRGLAHAAGVFLGLPEAPIRNISIRRLKIVSLDPDAVATAPIMADHIRPMRHEMILTEQAEIDCDEPALLSRSFVSLLSARV